MPPKLNISGPSDFRHVHHAHPPGETENLTELEHLDEGTLLAELKIRYQKDIIYTYVGEILVAVNPFKPMDGLYDDTHAAKYTQIGNRAAHAPHIFAVADMAFTSMVQNPPGKAANQVSVISGESGAGKTESAKLFIKQLIHLSTRQGSYDASRSKGLEEKIVQLNPLLEAFGNAQTLMNDNSSRFGKFIELRFNATHNVEGALIYEYLLEKSRVVRQNPGERNFHVFYLFFAGLSDAQKDKYRLEDASEHRYLNGNDTALSEIGSARTRAQFAELRKCMDIVGFDPQEVDDLFAILAGILHIGDIEFAGDESAYIVSADDVMGKISECLQVDIDALRAALTRTINITRGEHIERTYKPFESDACRDAMAKALYGHAFSWIVKRVNLLLAPPMHEIGQTMKTIGILDIFGFECFNVNSFEQLLINLANEQLQFFFNNHIFKMELEEYAREGIDGSKIEYADNQGLLDMLLAKPIGILAVCDEEASFPKGTDKSMVEKFHANFAANPGYEKPKSNDAIFGIHHYAGRVVYTADGFLEKNRDTLALDVIGVLRISSCHLVHHLFGGDDEDAAIARQKFNSKQRNEKEAKKNLRRSVKKASKMEAKTKKTTVGNEFKLSLSVLMLEMGRAAPHFVRCIKPNLAKAANNYDGDLVTKQLRYTGMLETTRIRKLGYPLRPVFADFIARYRAIAFPYTQAVTPAEGPCRRILEKAKATGWQVGKTKVFLKYYHADQLGECLVPFPRAAIKLQKVARGFLGRAKFKKLVVEAKRQAKAVEEMCLLMERNLAGVVSITQSLAEEDERRPAELLVSPPPRITRDPTLKKLAKTAELEQKKSGGLSRAASVKWFKEVEMKKGAGMKGGTFEEWFHGVITRREAEELLRGKEPGTFLVRVSESRFGYSLSQCVVQNGRIRHFLIEQNEHGQYVLSGNTKEFPSLNSLIEFHTIHRINTDDDVCLVFPCGQADGKDDRAEFLKKK